MVQFLSHACAYPCLVVHSDGSFRMISFGLQPLAAFFVGAVAETSGVQTAIVLNGTLLISAAALILALRPGLRTWEVKAKPSEPAEPALSPATGD